MLFDISLHTYCIDHQEYDIIKDRNKYHFNDLCKMQGVYKMKSNYCLVLAGGGTRGTYQVGAWNAIKEMNIPVSAIAGTSIGAINAAFMIQGDAEKLEQLYYDIEVGDVIDTEVEVGENKSLFNINNIVRVARDYIRQKGFNNEPLRILLEQNLDIEKIYNSSIDFGLVTYSVKDHKPVEIFKKDIKKDELIGYILASACFPIYKAQKIGENTFLDGGLYDNLPINMLIREGYRKFIALDISWIGIKRNLISKEAYIKLIRPCESIGGIFEFDKDRMKKNMRMGYLDTLRAFCKLQGHRYYFRTADFNKLLTVFSLQTVAGLESAAQIYGMNEYKIYGVDDFLKELHDKNRDAALRYQEIKNSLGITTIVKGYEKIRNMIHKDLILSFFIDRIAEEPFFNAIGENLPFSDYIGAACAIIEFENTYYGKVL